MEAEGAGEEAERARKEGGSSEQDKDCGCMTEREREREITRQTKKRKKNYSFFNVGKKRWRINCSLWNPHSPRTHKTTPPGLPFGLTAPSKASTAAAAGTEKKIKVIKGKRETETEGEKETGRQSERAPNTQAKTGRPWEDPQFECRAWWRPHGADARAPLSVCVCACVRVCCWVGVFTVWVVVCACHGEHGEHGESAGCNPVQSRPSQTADAWASRAGGEVFHRSGNRSSRTLTRTLTRTNSCKIHD